MSSTRRWHRQKSKDQAFGAGTKEAFEVQSCEPHRLTNETADVKALDPNISGAAENHIGRILASGEAYFPVMTQQEVAAISVPASETEQVRLRLEEQGVCLVTGVLNQQECTDFEHLWQADLLSVLDTTKGDDSTMSAVKRLHKEGITAWPQDWSSGLGKKGSVSARGLPHGSFAWHARLHTGVRKIFANIFKTTTDNLAVGLDCTFWSGADSPAAQSNKEWLHCDQNHLTGLTWDCMQGVLYVWPSEGETASTTVIWPGSHRDVYTEIMHDRTAYNRGRKGSQSIQLSQLSDSMLREELTAQAMSNSRRVPCPAGSLLLWDSRTIHQGWAGGPRLAQPVCWEPRERREKDRGALQRKMFMCATGIPSSHSSSEARIHGMAPRSRPCELYPGVESPAMRPQIVPYGVAEKEKEQWQKTQALLWGTRSDPNQADACTLHSLLKPEVFSVL